MILVKRLCLTVFEWEILVEYHKTKGQEMEESCILVTTQSLENLRIIAQIPIYSTTAITQTDRDIVTYRLN